MKVYSLSEAEPEIQANYKKYHRIFGELTDTMVIESYEAGEDIIYFHKPLERLRFLIEGRAKILMLHENGAQSILHFVHPGEYLGELTFLEIEKEHRNVQAITPCIFVSVEMEEAGRILKKDPDFLFELGQFVGEKMLERTHFSSKSQTYELKNRLASYILTTQHKGIYKEKHTETAEYLGVSYRHLLYTIKNFMDEGILTKLDKGYGIQEEALYELARDIYEK